VEDGVVREWEGEGDWYETGGGRVEEEDLLEVKAWRRFPLEERRGGGKGRG